MFDGSTAGRSTWLTSLLFSPLGCLGVVAEPSTRLACQQEKTKAQARARASRASSGEMTDRGRTTIRGASLISFSSGLLPLTSNGEVGNLHLCVSIGRYRTRCRHDR